MKCQNAYCFKQIEHQNTIKLNQEDLGDYGHYKKRESYILCDTCFNYALFKLRFMFTLDALTKPR